MKYQIKKITNLLKEGIPIRTALSLLYQKNINRNELLWINFNGEKYWLRCDPATFVYGYNAVKKIRFITEKLKKKPISVLVDVGANNGWFSASLARTHPGLRSYLIEPNHILSSAIEYNLNSLDIDYSLDFIGISNVCGKTPFNFAKNNCQQSSLIREAITIFSKNQPIEQQEIEVSTLDSFCKTHSINSIDLLKVDIQGAEHLLLEGAKQALLNTKMALFEISFIEKHAIDVFCSLFQEFGFYQVLAPVSYGADILFLRNSE